jgi:hypothetical protein
MREALDEDAPQRIVYHFGTRPVPSSKSLARASRHPSSSTRLSVIVPIALSSCWVVRPSGWRPEPVSYLT